MTRKNQLAQQETTTSKQPKDAQFKAFQIYADMSKVDRTWEKYGYLKAPLAVKKENGEFSSRSHKSQVLIHNQDFRRLLSNFFAFCPHEFIGDVLDRNVLKNLDDLKMHIEKEYEAHDGDSHYWTILSDEKFEMDGHDNFQFGVSIRNGIGTNVSLGADLYTMRQWCTNGAVARGRNFGSFSIPHLGKVELIAAYFEKAIRQTFQKSKELMYIYNKARKIKINDALATEIYKKMPFAAKYLPDNWNVTSRYTIKYLKSVDKLTDDLKLVEVYGKDQSLMDAFNAITEKQRDGLRTGRINFAAVSTHQVGLHNAMIQIVNNPSNRRV